MPPAPLAIIPANPGQTIVRIWVDFDLETFVEHWPVIAWRIMDGWAEPVCTHPKSLEEQAEFFIQPDGRLADLDGEEVFDDVAAARASMVAAYKREAAERGES